MLLLLLRKVRRLLRAAQKEHERVDHDLAPTSDDPVEPADNDRLLSAACCYSRLLRRVGWGLLVLLRRRRPAAAPVTRSLGIGVRSGGIPPLLLPRLAAGVILV